MKTHDSGHKYQILSEAKRRGYTVSFSELYHARSADIEEELGSMEGYYIRTLHPPLNTQIPKESNWRKYDYNAKALTITLDEILNQ